MDLHKHLINLNREAIGSFGRAGCSAKGLRSSVVEIYSRCQKNVPIAERFFCYNTYAAIFFWEHYYDNWYNYKPFKKTNLIRVLTTFHNLPINPVLQRSSFLFH
jgi:hypothetical protein